MNNNGNNWAFAVVLSPVLFALAFLWLLGRGLRAARTIYLMTRTD